MCETNILADLGGGGGANLGKWLLALAGKAGLGHSVGAPPPPTEIAILDSNTALTHCQLSKTT